MKDNGQDIRKPTFIPANSNGIGASRTSTLQSPTDVIMTNPSVERTISLEEYKSLSSSTLDPTIRQALFVVKGAVYDGRSFLNEHPGGADSIWLAAGEPDATEDFMTIHSDDAKKKLIPVCRVESLFRVSGLSWFCHLSFTSVLSRRLMRRMLQMIATKTPPCSSTSENGNRSLLPLLLLCRTTLPSSDFPYRLLRCTSDYLSANTFLLDCEGRERALEPMGNLEKWYRERIHLCRDLMTVGISIC